MQQTVLASEMLSAGIKHSEELFSQQDPLVSPTKASFVRDEFSVRVACLYNVSNCMMRFD